MVMLFNIVIEKKIVYIFFASAAMRRMRFSNQNNFIDELKRVIRISLQLLLLFSNRCEIKVR